MNGSAKKAVGGIRPWTSRATHRKPMAVSGGISEHDQLDRWLEAHDRREQQHEDVDAEIADRGPVIVEILPAARASGRGRARPGSGPCARTGPRAAGSAGRSAGWSSPRRRARGTRALPTTGAHRLASPPLWPAETISTRTPCYSPRASLASERAIVHAGRGRIRAINHKPLEPTQMGK